MTDAMEWIKNNLHPEGGVRARPGGPAYPEITGYLIPTLMNQGETDLAYQFGDWLVDIQNDDGSFNGLDGVPRAFDTAACYEGLWEIDHQVSARKARKYLETMHQAGVFWTDNKKKEQNDYTLRINGILDIDRELPDKLWPNRTHYIAYALEGAWELGYSDWVIEKLKWVRAHLRNGLAPYEFAGKNISLGTDLCATAQIGCLLIKAGMGDHGTIKALDREIPGSYPHSWTAKYHLDLIHLYMSIGLWAK